MRLSRVQRDLLVAALRRLFEVAERLYAERKAAGAPEEAAPIVLLFDDVDALLQAPQGFNLDVAHGRVVFNELAGLLVAHGANRGTVRAAVAGGSALLPMVWELDRAAASSPRWSYHQILDPDPNTVLAALAEKGYSAAEARSMVALVGTRLRLLQGPLEMGAMAVSCSTFLKVSRETGVANFRDLLAKTAAKDSLVDTLERIVAHEAGGGAEPSLTDMPAALRALDLWKVLHVRLDGTLTFQSQLHRVAWGELRSDYTAPTPQLR
jgi:hypothetical protein